MYSLVLQIELHRVTDVLLYLLTFTDVSSRERFRTTLPLGAPKTRRHSRCAPRLPDRTATDAAQRDRLSLTASGRLDYL